jgi:hypothetical protein
MLGCIKVIFTIGEHTRKGVHVSGKGPNKTNSSALGLGNVTFEIRTGDNAPVVIAIRS